MRVQYVLFMTLLPYSTERQPGDGARAAATAVIEGATGDGGRANGAPADAWDGSWRSLCS